MVNNQFNISNGNLGPNKPDAVPSNGSNNNNNNNNNKTKNNNSNNTNNHNTSNSNSNNNPNNNFPFEYSNWEDTPDLNFLSDASHLQMDSPNTNLPNSYMPNLMSPMNLNNNAPSPADYALQLQHYQNLLLETQNMLNLKQLQKNNDSEGNQNSSNLIDSNRLHNLSQNSPLNSNQNFQMNFPNSPNLSTFLSNATNPQLLLSQQPQLQQQLALQLAQAQLGNQNKIMRNQFQMDNRSQNLSAAPGSISTPASSSSIPALNQGNVQSIQLNDNSINTSTTPTTTITPSSTLNSSTKLGSNINTNDTNHGNNNSKVKKSEPPQPRTKIRPCDHCRRRKTKCVMIPELHSCKMCQTKGLKCTFNETNSSFKRGLSGNEPDSKRMKFDDPTIEPPPNIALRDVHPIKDYATMQGHSLLKKTLSLQYPRSSFYVGPTSIYDPIFLNKVTLDKIDQFQLNKTNSIRNVSKSVQFMLRDDFSEVLYERAERDSDTVERYVAPHGQALIDLYFRTVHPSFPVLHKKIFLEKYSRTHREFGAPLLAAVYLLAIQWWDYEPNLSQFPKPNVDSLHKFATKAFADIIQRPKLSAVQAGLLLLQCRTPNSSDKNWLLCSEVVAVAEELGLGLDCSNWRLPKWERGLRRRLAWAVYIQDKWSALVESRPSHIYEGKNWLVKHVSDEDFPEKGNEATDVVKEGCADIDNGKESFKQLISLSEILSEILDTFFTKIAMEKIVTIDQVLSHAKPLQLKLRQWYHLLSKELQMSSLKPRQFNSNGTLQLAYFATEITLHRRIISALCSQSYPPPPPEILKVCRNAAKTRLTASIEFTRDLKAEHMQAFWHSAAVNNFALIGIFAALLFVTSEDPDEANGFKEQLFDYRWVLKVNSRSFGIANEALEKIDGILKNIPGLLAEYIPNTPGSNTPQPQPQHTPNTAGTPNSVTSGNKKTSTPGNRKKTSTGGVNSNNANSNPTSTSMANLQMLNSISNSSNKDKSSAASTPALSTSAGIFRGSPRSQINSPVTQVKSPMSMRSPQHNKKGKEDDKREEKNDKMEDDKKEEKRDDKKIDNKIASNRNNNSNNSNKGNNNNSNSEDSKDKNEGDDDIYLSQFNNLNMPQFNMNMMNQMNSLMGINVMNMNELGNGGDDTNSGDSDNKKD